MPTKILAIGDVVCLKSQFNDTNKILMTIFNIQDDVASCCYFYEGTLKVVKVDAIALKYIPIT